MINIFRRSISESGLHTCLGVTFPPQKCELNNNGIINNKPYLKKVSLNHNTESAIVALIEMLGGSEAAEALKNQGTKDDLENAVVVVDSVDR